MTEKPPNIYAYLDYRDFLRDLYGHLKATERGFSYRKFAMRAGYSSPNNLKRVIDGDRNLSEDAIRRFSKALRLSKTETEYFEALVRWNQETDPKVRKQFEAVIRRYAITFQTDPLSEDAYDYLSNALNPIIREMINRDDRSQATTDIRQDLYFSVTSRQIRQILATLKRLALVTEEDDRLDQAQNVIRTDESISHIAVREYHRTAIDLAAQALDKVPVEDRMYGGVTASISESRLAHLRAFLDEQRQALAAFLAEDDGQPIDRVVQINYQMFPVSKPVEESS